MQQQFFRLPDIDEKSGFRLNVRELCDSSLPKPLVRRSKCLSFAHCYSDDFNADELFHEIECHYLLSFSATFRLKRSNDVPISCSMRERRRFPGLTYCTAHPSHCGESYSKLRAFAQ